MYMYLSLFHHQHHHHLFFNCFCTVLAILAFPQVFPYFLQGPLLYITMVAGYKAHYAVILGVDFCCYIYFFPSLFFFPIKTSPALQLN